MMTTLDWVIFGAVWSLIPVLLLAKAVLDRQSARSERECWSRVTEIVKGRR